MSIISAKLRVRNDALLLTQESESLSQMLREHVLRLEDNLGIIWLNHA